ncbi:hypothetical protein [Pseudanabaena sp. PCC 6802]|nr:hypothetical protein [Pseudanabaena sp. PCC 6802]
MWKLEKPNNFFQDFHPKFTDARCRGSAPVPALNYPMLALNQLERSRSL